MHQSKHSNHNVNTLRVIKVQPRCPGSKQTSKEQRFSYFSLCHLSSPFLTDLLVGFPHPSPGPHKRRSRVKSCPRETIGFNPRWTQREICAGLDKKESFRLTFRQTWFPSCDIIFIFFQLHVSSADEYPQSFRMSVHSLSLRQVMMSIPFFCFLFFLSQKTPLSVNEINAKMCFLAQTKGRTERERERKGKEKGKGKLEVKLLEETEVQTPNQRLGKKDIVQ